MPLLDGGNIANVERIKIVTDETTARTFVFKTSTSATFQASVSSGVEKEQRVKNAILGLIKTEDIVKGYDIDVEDQRLIMDVFALIDGGTVTTETDGWTKYEAPAAGSTVTRTPFTLSLYTSDRDSDGSANEYYEWKFFGCKGTPVSGGAKDDDFQTIKYSIKARPANGVSPMTLERADTLPDVT